MSDKDARISELSKRFEKRASDRKGIKRSKRERKLRSVLLDEALLQQFDDSHHEISGEFYPTKMSKARYLEALIECGLANIGKVKNILEQDPA
jgi:hypothetical protein